MNSVNPNPLVLVYRKYAENMSQNHNIYSSPKSTILGRMTDFLTTFPDIRFCCKWLHFVITKSKDEVGCMAKSRTFFWRGVLTLVSGRSSTNVTAQKSSHVAHLMRIIKVHVISEAYI